MKISDSKTILKALGCDETQQTHVCCYTLLALAKIAPSSEWSSATNEWMRSRDILDFLLQNYNKKYADGSREHIRKEALHISCYNFAIRNPKCHDCASIRL